MRLLAIYLTLINALGLLLMCLDKHYARKKMWRIPEQTLMVVAALGGSLGSLLGMYLFRHKTKHRKFTAGVPLFLVLHLILLTLLILWRQGLRFC